MPREFLIYYDERIASNDKLIEQLIEIIINTYGIKTREVGIRIPPANVFDEQTHSYYPTALIDVLIKDGIYNFLWIISENLSIDGKEILGFAEKRKGAVLSTKNLYNKTMLIVNEALFLVGQIYGLNLCVNECIMHSAENLNDLLAKPNKLCKSCEIKFQRFKTTF